MYSWIDKFEQIGEYAKIFSVSGIKEFGWAVCLQILTCNLFGIKMLKSFSVHNVQEFMLAKIVPELQLAICLRSWI